MRIKITVKQMEASTKIDFDPFSRLHRTMPSLWTSLNNVSDEIYQKSNTGRNEFTDEIVARALTNVYQIAFYAKRHSERILDQGSVNFLMLERWMGEIIEMENDSVAHFSKVGPEFSRCINTGRSFACFRIFIHTTY